MKLLLYRQPRENGSALIGYLIMALIIIGTIAAIAGYVVQNIKMSSRRQDMVNAIQFAQGGAVLAARDLGIAYTNSGNFFSNLTSAASGSYVKNTALSTNNQLAYERTITSPFTNQSVKAQLWVTNVANPTAAKILATATVGNSVQSSQINVELQFGYAAAIISTSTNSVATGVSKGNAQNGNVVVDGGASGTTKIDGGVLANGSVNTNLCLVDSISQTNRSTSAQIPDYTSPGSLYQLFDFNRFIAVAKATGNHYTNAAAFETAAGAGAVLEGIIVVDCPKGGTLPTLSPTKFPLGINVRGTLVFNFTGAWSPLEKIVNTADMYINKADLSGLVATNPATYTTGYPPTYSNPAKNPVGVIAPGFPDPFTADDDLPALMYNNAILDIHGNANVCGAIYSSSFMEIENKKDGQTQYFKGALIGGGGIFVENGKNANSIVSYDANAMSNLATAAGRGKKVIATYRK